MGLMTALTIGAIGMSAYGKYREGQDKASAADYNRKVYEQQAGIIAQKGKLAKEEGARRRKHLAGKAMAKTAKMGLDFSGSPADVFLDSMTQFDLDQLKEQWNIGLERNQALSSADRYKTASSQYRRAGAFNAFSKALSGGMSAYKSGMLNFGNSGGA